MARRDFPRLAHRSKSPNSKLLRLPDELLWMVFQNLGPECLSDAVRLCLADGRLLDIGYHEVQKLKRLVYADCVGDRVACIGGYATIEDFPENMKALVKEHVAQAGDLLREDESKDDEDEFRPDDFCWVAERVYIDVERGSHVRCDIYTDTMISRRMLEGEWDAYRRLHDPLYDSSQPWVLCNISKGLYVRVDAATGLGGEDSTGTPFRVGLDQVLLSQVCWSLDDSLAMRSEYEDEGGDIFELHRGPWAGDRFEVTTMDRMKKNIDWKDDSVRVLGLVVQIYKEA